MAYGEPAIQCARKSIGSLLSHEPDMDYRLITDRRIDGLRCTFAVAQDKGARDVKTQLPSFVPRGWEQCLYVDADTVILGTLDRFFNPLEQGWEMVMVRDRLADAVIRCRLKKREEFRYLAQAYEGGELTQFSGGIMSWAVSKNTLRFFRQWHAEWERFRYRDQGALVRALALTPVKLWPLGWKANGPDPEIAVEVWHQHGAARQKGAQ